MKTLVLVSPVCPTPFPKTGTDQRGCRAGSVVTLVSMMKLDGSMPSTCLHTAFRLLPKRPLQMQEVGETSGLEVSYEASSPFGGYLGVECFS